MGSLIPNGKQIAKVAKWLHGDLGDLASLQPNTFPAMHLRHEHLSSLGSGSL
jgi:hypothetical protein